MQSVCDSMSFLIILPDESCVPSMKCTFISTFRSYIMLWEIRIINWTRFILINKENKILHKITIVSQRIVENRISLFWQISCRNEKHFWASFHWENKHARLFHWIFFWFFAFCRYTDGWNTFPRMDRCSKRGLGYASQII